MEITLLRHGKPDIPSLKKLSASAFNKWVQDYNASALLVSSKPTHEALTCVSNSKAIVCSNLQRSIDSANVLNAEKVILSDSISNVLNAEKVILSDSIFNEAGLPSANWHSLKLSPTLWAVFFRMLWLLGYSRNSESFKEAKTRAVEAVRILTELAKEHQKVIFVGHGVYNRILANELRRIGWAGPKNPGSKHWGYGVYKL